MKTSLIHLAPSADWRSAVARIRGGPQGRVIINWPAKDGLRSPLAVLRLMQRRSLRLGVPLAVVASSAYIRTESARLGLPLFTNTRQARKEDWGLSQPSAPPAAQRVRNSAQSLRASATTRRVSHFQR